MKAHISKEWVLKELKEWGIALLEAFIIFLILRTWIIATYYVPTGSMIPTIMPGERLIGLKFILWFTKPKRGSIIIFRYPKNPKTIFVKRLIGLPGDTIEIRNGQVFVNGRKLDEPYVKYRSHEDYGPVKVPEGCYFVLGDNRPVSDDSRYWGFLPEKNLEAIGVFVYWPVWRMRVLR